VSVSSAPSPKTMFASSSLIEHLLRGVIGICTLSYAISISAQHSVYSLALAGVSLLAFRGCPICWTIGLAETIRQRYGMKGRLE